MANIRGLEIKTKGDGVIAVGYVATLANRVLAEIDEFEASRREDVSEGARISIYKHRPKNPWFTFLKDGEEVKAELKVGKNRFKCRGTVVALSPLVIDSGVWDRV